MYKRLLDCFRRSPYRTLQGPFAFSTSLLTKYTTVADALDVSQEVWDAFGCFADFTKLAAAVGTEVGGD